MELLKELYSIYSPSFREKYMSECVKEKLEEMEINDFEVDNDYQIFRLKKDTILLCAHMDQVSSKPISKLFTSPDGNYIFADGNLGADDKNGVWIILNLLKKHKDLSFIFSTGEESGGNIQSIVKDHSEIMNTLLYGLIFDRRGSGDIIGTHNKYCEKDLEDKIYELGKPLGYSPTRGIFSDCDKISNETPCVNLSAGYYSAHTEKEFTDLSDLKRALMFGEIILDSITETKFERVKSYSYSSSYYSGYDIIDNRKYKTDYYKQSTWDKKGIGSSYSYKSYTPDYQNCSKCNNRFLKMYMSHIDGEYFCGNCINEKKGNKSSIAPCTTCKCTMNVSFLKSIDDKWYCTRCAKLIEKEKEEENEDKLILCEKCGYSYMKQFMVELENRKGKYLCDLCYDDLLDLTTSGDPLYYCTDCDQYFKQSDELPTDKCVFCDAEDTIIEIEDPEEKDLDNVIQYSPMICPKCDKEYEVPEKEIYYAVCEECECFLVSDRTELITAPV